MIKLNDIGLPFKITTHSCVYKGIKRITYKLRLAGNYNNIKLFHDYIGDCPVEIYNVYGYKWDFYPYKILKENIN
jgi:hypothetical protein